MSHGLRQKTQKKLAATAQVLHYPSAGQPARGAK
jgi:hypothetical protein